VLGEEELVTGRVDRHGLAQLCRCVFLLVHLTGRPLGFGSGLCKRLAKRNFGIQAVEPAKVLGIDLLCWVTTIKKKGGGQKKRGLVGSYLSPDLQTVQFVLGAEYTALVDVGLEIVTLHLEHGKGLVVFLKDFGEAGVVERRVVAQHAQLNVEGLEVVLDLLAIALWHLFHICPLDLSKKSTVSGRARTRPILLAFVCRRPNSAVDSASLAA